jgi:hypothetical protein
MRKQPLAEYMEKVMRLVGGWYWSGCWGQTGTENLWSQKSQQKDIKQWYIEHADAKAKGLNKKVTDCTGVYKYPLWVQSNGSVPYNAIPNTDTDTDGIFNLAKSSGCKWGKIATIPKERQGILVTYQGHMGVYIGNGKVLESRGGAFGVVTTNLNERGWTEWYENPYVDYGGNSSMDKIIKGSTGTLVEKWQRFLKFMGYDIGKFGANKDGIDGEFGSTGVRVTNEYKKAIGMAEDGTVDIETALTVIDRLCGEIQNLKAIIAENSTNSNNKIAAMNNQLSDLTVQLELKDKEVCDAEMKVVEFENKAGALETENALLKKDNTDLTQQSELQQIRYAELVKESISKEQVINTLNGKILTLNTEIESMRKVKPTEIVIPKETLASLMRRLFKLK